MTVVFQISSLSLVSLGKPDTSSQPIRFNLPPIGLGHSHFSRAFGSVLISSTSSHWGPCGIPFWLEWLLCFVLFFFLRLSIFFFFFLTLSDKVSILCLEDYQSFFLWKKLNLRGRPLVVFVGKCTGSISSQNEPPWICKYVYVAWWAKCKNLYGNKRCRHFQPKNLN